MISGLYDKNENDVSFLVTAVKIFNEYIQVAFWCQVIQRVYSYYIQVTSDKISNDCIQMTFGGQDFQRVHSGVKCVEEIV